MISFALPPFLTLHAVPSQTYVLSVTLLLDVLNGVELSPLSFSRGN